MKMSEVKEIQIELPISNEDYREYYQDDRVVLDLIQYVYDKSEYKKVFGGESLPMNIYTIGGTKRFEIIMRVTSNHDQNYIQRVELLEKVFNDFCKIQDQYFKFREFVDITKRLGNRLEAKKNAR